MRRVTLVALALGMALCLGINWTFPPHATSTLEIYPRLTDSGYELMREETDVLAENLACLAAAIERRDPNKNFDEPSVRGAPFLLADNSRPKLLVITHLEMGVMQLTCVTGSADGAMWGDAMSR